MKINIINAVALNGGDAAILFAEIALLKSIFGEDTDFSIYDNKPHIARKYYGNLDFNPGIFPLVVNSTSASRWLRFIGNKVKYVRFLFGLSFFKLNRGLGRLIITKAQYEWLVKFGQADLVVSTGGTYLVEHYNLDSRILECSVALTFGKPLVFFTQSLGPFAKKRYIHHFRNIFNKSALILVRDNLSRKNLEEIDVAASKIHVYPDVVFSFPLQPAGGKSPELRVAVSVRNWKTFKGKSSDEGMSDYKKAVRDMVTYLVQAHKAKIEFISTCQGIPEYWTDDSKIALEIYKELPPMVQESVTVNSSFHDPAELRTLLKDFHLAVATRMHTAILAMSVGVPVLPIAYEFKTEELFKDLQLSEWVFNIESIDSEKLISKVGQFVGSLDSVSRVMTANVGRLHRAAKDSGDKVRAVMAAQGAIR